MYLYLDNLFFLVVKCNFKMSSCIYENDQFIIFSREKQNVKTFLFYFIINVD